MGPIFYFICLVATAVALALAFGILPEPTWLKFEQSPSPGLANLIAFLIVIATWGLFRALVFPLKRDAPFLERWLDGPGAHVALDILAILGGAAFIVWLGNALA
jgi:hypothetical protein